MDGLYETNTINASSTVPANTPTFPTVQFRGITLKKMLQDFQFN